MMPVNVKEQRKGRGATERLTEFVREVRSELRKVVWPTREESIRLTGVVIGVCAVVGIFLGAVDSAFAQMFALLLR